MSMKRDIQTVERIIRRLVQKTQMDIILTATSEDTSVRVELTLVPKSPDGKRAGF